MPLSHGPLFAQFMPIIDVSKIQQTHKSKMHRCICKNFADIRLVEIQEEINRQNCETKLNS